MVVAVVGGSSIGTFKSANDVPEGATVLCEEAFATTLSIATMDALRAQILGDDARRSSSQEGAAAALKLALNCAIEPVQVSKFLKFSAVVTRREKQLGKREALKFVYRKNNLDDRVKFKTLSHIGRGLATGLSLLGKSYFLEEELELEAVKVYRTLGFKGPTLANLWRRGSFGNHDKEGRDELLKSGLLQKVTYLEYVEGMNRGRDKG